MWKESYQNILFVLLILLISSIIFPCIHAGISTTSMSQDIYTTPNKNPKDPWPMFRHDYRHTAYTIYSGPSEPKLKWKYNVDKPIVSSAAISHDGTIYFGSGLEVNDKEGGTIYALHSDGSLKWKYEGYRGFFSSPALGPGNMIYISSLDGKLFAIKDENTRGIKQWETPLKFFFNLCSPLIDPNGIIHIGSPSFSYYQINETGKILWQYETEWCIISSPAMDSNGVIYVGSKDHNLYAFNTNPPSLKWKFSAGTFYDGHLVDSSPAIGKDGTIYFGTDPYGAFDQDPILVHDNIWAVNPDGTLKWVVETEDGVESSPAIGPDGTIYIGSYDGNLYAIQDNDTHGYIKWTYQTDGAIDGSPIVDGNGIIYIGSRDGNLYSFYPNGTVQWVFETEEGFESSPSIDGNGYLYIGGFDSYFYCIGSGNPDIGVHTINISDQVIPNAIITPSALVINHRSATQDCTISCTILQNQAVLYEQSASLQLTDGEQRNVSFQPWTVNADENTNFTISIEVYHPDDIQTMNNILSKTIEVSTNNEPLSPTITGVYSGTIYQPYEFEFQSTDPDNNEIQYIIDWGDSHSFDETAFFSSGFRYSTNHTWDMKGSFSIKAKTKDIWGAESNWTYHEICIPKSTVFHRFINRYHALFFHFMLFQQA